MSTITHNHTATYGCQTQMQLKLFTLVFQAATVTSAFTSTRCHRITYITPAVSSLTLHAKLHYLQTLPVHLTGHSHAIAGYQHHVKTMQVMSV